MRYNLSKNLVLAGAILVSGCGKVTNLSEQAGITFGAAKPLVLPAQELLPVSLEIPYKEIIAVDGGQAPFTFRITHGELLEGLSLDAATGVISGQISKAMIAKQMNFSLEVNDSSGLKAEQSYKIHAADYSFSIAPDSLPTITPGISFAMKLSVQGAVDPVKFSVSGALPQKLTLGSDGALMTTGSGVEATNEKSEWPIEVMATDANKVSATAKYTVKIGAAPRERKLFCVNQRQVSSRVEGSAPRTRF